MKYFLKYYTSSKYLFFTKEHYKYFNTIQEVRDFLINNIEKIDNYLIYKLTDLSNK